MPPAPPDAQQIECALQVAGVFLLDDEDVLERAAQAVLLQHLGLTYARAIARDCVELTLEVLLEHDLRVGRDVDVGDVHVGDATEKVDLVAERDRVLMLLA